MNEKMNDHNQLTKQVKIGDSNFISEDGVMKFDFMTSLQHIALAKIMNNLWMDSSVLQVVKDFIYDDLCKDLFDRRGSDTWKEIENSVVAKVSDLFLPKSVISELINMVPGVGNSILNWIHFNDKYLLDCGKNSRYSIVDHIGNIIWTARGKIDYAETAKSILADANTSLSNDHKYKIACAYCLEDEIAVLATDVVDASYLDSVKINIQPMVYYWTAQVTGDDTKLYNPSYIPHYLRNNNMSNNQKIFLFLVNNEGSIYKTLNEVGICHMWNKLSTQEKTSNIALFVYELCYQDLIYSLLSDINYDQQQKLFKYRSFNILNNMLSNSFWRKYFLPTALHVLDIIDPLSYFEILYEITNKKAEEEDNYLCDQYKHFFEILWKQGSIHLKEYIIKHGIPNNFERLIMALSWEQDMDIIRLMFNDLTPEERDAMIYKDDIYDRCEYFAKNDQLDLLELFLKSTLISENDLRHFKWEMGDNKMHHIDKDTLDDKTERFLDWAFEPEEIHDVREAIVYRKLTVMVKSIITNNKVDFAQFEKDLKWYAKNDLKMINKFKSELPAVLFTGINENDILWGLLVKGKYELLNQLLSWCFLDDQIKVAQFKSTIYRRSCLGFQIFTVLLFERDDSHIMLNKFIDWCFANDQEVQEYKRWLLNPALKPFHKRSVCTDFLVKNHLELADKIIEWCVTSDEDIRKFKAMLMISDDMSFIFSKHELLRRKRKPDLSLLIKWFNPSKELVEDFKKLFPEEKCPDNFYQLLDDFLKSCS